MAAEEAQVQPAQQLISPEDYQLLGNSNTVERKLEFLQAYREEGSIFHACAKCRMSRRTVYVWMEEDAQFAEAVADSKEDTYDNLETSVYKRAFKSDLLAMFYLKAHRPKFRDKLQLDIGTIQDEIEAMMSKLDQRRLPPAVTEFIDTSYSQADGEYQTEDSIPVPTPLQFSTEPEHNQKEVLSDPSTLDE